MADHWGAALIPAVLLALLAARARIRGGSWLEPSALFALAWSLYVLLPLLLAPDFEVWPAGVWWILLSVFCVSCGSWWADSGKRRNLQNATPDGSRRTALQTFSAIVPQLRVALIASLVCGLLYSIVAILDFGMDLRTLFSIEGVVEIARAFSVDRYSETYVPPSLLVQIWLIGVYAAPIFGGILFSLRRHKVDLWLSIASIIPGFSVFVLQTTRAAVVTALILWVAGFFAQRALMDRGGFRLFAKQRLYALTGLAMLLIVIFGVGQVMRGGDTPEAAAVQDMVLSDTPRVWMLGHLSVFTQWFRETRFGLDSPAMGAYSLAGVFEQLGLHPRPLGLYIDRYELLPGLYSNIYTVFRGFIEDFTLPGSLVFLFLLGKWAGAAYDRVREGNLHYVPVLVAFYAFVGSYGVSIFNYNSILFAWLGASLFLWRVQIGKQRFASKRTPANPTN